MDDGKSVEGEVFGVVRHGSKADFKAIREGMFPMRGLYAVPWLLAGMPGGRDGMHDRGAEMAQAHAAFSTLMSSGLHKALEEGWGKCDGMVDGKYKRARCFVFETESWLVVALTETGDRGSGWYAGKRGDVGKAHPGFYSPYELEATASDGELLELSKFLKGLVLGISRGSSDEAEWLRGSSPGLLVGIEEEGLAAVHGRELEDGVRKACGRVRKAGI